MEVKERKENYMKKNSFTQVLVIAIAAVCIICAVVMINVSNESEKCIKSGCDNDRAYEGEYCYKHKPSSKKSKSSETPSYNKNLQIVHLKNILRIAQVAALIVILIAITIRINRHQEVNHHINLMTMVMMTSIWTTIMTMRDTRMTRIMPME